MTSIRRYKILMDGSAAETSDWVRLDNRYGGDIDRIINVDLTTGDTIALQGIVKDVRGQKPADFFTSLDADDISTIETFTADSTEHLLQGPWSYIRVVKTGTAGVAKVSGYV